MMIDDATLQNALDACPTPLYLFDQQVLNDRITRLRASLPSRIKLCYAMKANPFIVREASALADCVEACSPGEVLICANAGVPFEKIVLSGVWKDRRCLDDLFQADRIPHRFTIESSQQLKDLVELANAYRRRVNVLFRLSSENQFGVDSATLKELIAGCKDDPFISIQGIQYYSGTQKTSLKKLDRELNKLHRIVAEVEAACSVKLNEIEYGPGLPVEYFDENEERARSAQDEPVAELATLLDGFPFEGDIVLELGRSIAADCGAYLTSVVENDERAKLRDRRRRHASDFVLRAFDGHEVPGFQEGRRNGRRCAALEHLRSALHGQRHPGQASADRRFVRGRRACVLSGRRLLRNGGSGAVFKPGSSVSGRARRFGKHAHCSASAGNGLVQFIERVAG